MNLEVIQFSTKSLYSIFIVRDYLHHIDLNNIDNVIRNHTTKDTMERRTNVKGTMTNYSALKEVPECVELFRKSAFTIDSIVKLRSVHSLDNYKYHVTDAWGMRHSKNDYSINHAHYPSHWAVAFYTTVPKPQPFMGFIEFDAEVKLEPNMLVVFPAMLNHRVSPNVSNEDRISMAFNIDVEKY